MIVACVWVKANVPYGVEYVERLAAMVKRHLPVPHRFVCLTDRPWLVPAHIDTMVVPSPGKLPGWWSKLELFRPDRFTGRVLYLDLDTLIVSSLLPIVEFDAPFALIPDGGSSFQPRNGLLVVKRFNSSVMVFDAQIESLRRLWQSFDATVPRRLWGDQDFIGDQVPDAATMPISWFPRLSSLHGHPPNSEARVVLAKRPKNIEAAQRWSWFDAIWRAA